MLRTLLLLFTILLTPLLAQAEQVLRIIDGDTIVVNNLIGEYHHPEDTETIRLYGIDTPEMNTDEGKEAKKYLQSILSVGQKVTLIRVTEDRYTRSVAIVLVGGGILQEQLLHSGHAIVYEKYCKMGICGWWKEITGQHLED